MFNMKTERKPGFRFPWPKMRPILLSIILTYLFAFIPMILIVTTTSLSLTNTIYENTLNNNMAASRRLARVTDASLGSVQTIAMNLFFDDEVMKLANQETVKDTAHLLNCWHVQKRLTMQKLMNDVIEEIYVHYPYSGTVITTKGLYRDGVFESSCLSLTKAAYPDWLKMEEYFGNYQFYLHPLANGSSGLTLVCRYYAQQERLQNVTVYLTLNEDCFETMVRPLKYMDESAVFLLDMTGSNTLFGASEYPLDNETIKRIIAADNGETILTDKQVITKTVSSKVKHWCYLSITSRALFDSHFTLRRNFVYGAIGSCVILSVLLTLLMAKRQYSPIQKIYQKLIGHDGAHVKNIEINEYKAIENSVTQLMNNLENRNYQLLEKQEQLRSHILMRILRNSCVSEKGMQRFREDYGIHFQHGGFVVLTIFLDNLSHPINDEDVDGPGIETAVNRLIATAVTGALSPAFDCSFAMDEDHFACIVNAGPQLLTGNGFKESVQKAYEYLKNKLHIEATFAVGSMKEKLSALSQSYHDAVTCMEYAQMTGSSGRVLYYQDLKLLPRIDMQYEHRLQQQKNFLYQMSLENYGDAFKTLAGIVESYERESPQSHVSLRLQIAFIEGILTFTLSNGRIFGDAGFIGSYLNHLDTLRNVQSTQALMSVLKRIFNEIEHWSGKNIVPTSAIISDVLAYVQKNFASPDISIGNIADQFNVSISYISRQFKQSYAMGLLDYIHKLRINTAKKLLEDNALTIKDVAFRVGYINSLTMSRSFKRHEGVLPSEYRAIHHVGSMSGNPF